MLDNKIRTSTARCWRVFIVLFGLACSGVAQSSQVKPVSELRDYNGTYAGSIGTGSVGYSTMYRDNYDNGATSGCRGEGCGRHPGVDIPVPSGTSVYAALPGTVVISRCDPAWGGLIVTRSQHPMRSFETIYVTYAHLRTREYGNQWLVNVGDVVGAGVKIGQSGGNPSTDICSGSSTGSHLHFQVDKNDGNSEPWFPSRSLLNTRDDNFSVTAKTYNPAVLILGQYRWRFGQAGNRELWSLFNFQSWGVSDGALWVDAGNDPYIRRGGLISCSLSKPCNSGISAEAGDYQRVYLDMYNHCAYSSGKVYFTTNAEPHWDENKTVPFFPTQGAFQTRVWMSSNSRWKGVITGLRIDPSEHCSPYIWDPTYYGEIALQR